MCSKFDHVRWRRWKLIDFVEPRATVSDLSLDMIWVCFIRLLMCLRLQNLNCEREDMKSLRYGEMLFDSAQ